MKYRTVMTAVAVAVMLAGLIFGLEGPQLLRFYGIVQPPGFIEPNMSFYRLRSFSFILGMVLFGFGLVTWRARKITEPGMQRSIALGHCHAYLMAGMMTFSQESALWGTRGGWLSAEFFLVLAIVFGYLGYIVLAGAMPKLQLAFDGDPESLRERWKREIGNAAAQQERNRLARDLHDSIKQQIFTIGVSAAAAQARWEGDPVGARMALDDVRGSAHEAMVEMEAMLQHLRPAPLETIGLVEALRKQCEALQYRTGAKVTSEFADLPENERLPPGTQEAIFRIAQEALANVARHARAQNVKVRLCADAKNESMIFQVQDDGQGFTPTTATEGMGMANIRARAQEIRGRLELWSQPGRGAKLAVCFPLLKTAERRVRWHFTLGALSMLAVMLIVALFLILNLVGKFEALIASPLALLFLMGAISHFFEVWRAMQSAPQKISLFRVLSKGIHEPW